MTRLKKEKETRFLQKQLNCDNKVNWFESIETGNEEKKNVGESQLSDKLVNHLHTRLLVRVNMQREKTNGRIWGH